MQMTDSPTPAVLEDERPSVERVYRALKSCDTDANGWVRDEQLREATGLTQRTLTPAVRRLVKHDLAERRHYPEDPRVRQTRLRKGCGGE